eukprot:CAMPEP_0170361982 /NCGR_PEP_ID=MMETSP0117_2-20130122/4091_1 /TAXON_ID=400756 /ORGANISM="Durinskia baltica, Strain CSIRO CS-38" /LENGTH=334 /DNA_ID=CAMNT_0010616373 /DNA_START=735 /DNA_END=1739 /DNA_ORIENTATION=-
MVQIAHSMGAYIAPVLSYVPLYGANMLLGYLIVANARDLADSSSMQLLMQAIYGLCFAFIVLGYVLFRMSKRVVGRYGGPLAELAHIPISFSILSMTLANPTILRSLQRAVWAFWHTGYPFGIVWIGKAYFISCILLCMAVCRYFALFESDTSSWHVMRYSVKLSGLVLLANGTSCLPLAMVLVLLGSFEDHIHHWLWVSYLTSNSIVAKPTYKYISQKKMSLAEAEELSRNYTKLALEGLRDHLKENPEQLDLVVDRFREGGKKDEAALVARFAGGNYPGVPYTVQAEDDGDEVMKGGKGKGGVWSWLSGWVGVVVAVVAVLLAVGGGLNLLT